MVVMVYIMLSNITRPLIIKEHVSRDDYKGVYHVTKVLPWERVSRTELVTALYSVWRELSLLNHYHMGYLELLSFLILGF